MIEPTGLRRGRRPACMHAARTHVRVTVGSRKLALISPTLNVEGTCSGALHIHQNSPPADAWRSRELDSGSSFSSGRHRGADAAFHPGISETRFCSAFCLMLACIELARMHRRRHRRLRGCHEPRLPTSSTTPYYIATPPTAPAPVTHRAPIASLIKLCSPTARPSLISASRQVNQARRGRLLQPDAR